MAENIAIVGRMYAGKTTLAENLVASHGYSRVAMAGPLKLIAQLAYGGVVEKDKEYPTIDRATGDLVIKSGRTILQQIGQSLKEVDRDIWLKIFINDTTQMGKEPYVCDDVRFQFEADYLKDQGWKIVKIETPEEERIRRAVRLTGVIPTEAELNHESEREVEAIAADAVYFGDSPIEYTKNVAAFLAGEYEGTNSGLHGVVLGGDALRRTN
jgi:dephospho-CoA kinase